MRATCVTLLSLLATIIIIIINMLITIISILINIILWKTPRFLLTTIVLMARGHYTKTPAVEICWMLREGEAITQTCLVVHCSRILQFRLLM